MGKIRSEKLRNKAEDIQQYYAEEDVNVKKMVVQQDLADVPMNEDDWGTWEMRVRGTKDPDRRDAIYQRALKNLPKSYQLEHNYALFLAGVQKDYTEAEKYYKKALEVDP